jgi:aldehyde dehydrogenase (NAD+)
MSKILKNLEINEISMGSCVGGNNWNDNDSSNYIESFNPTNGELLGKVQLCNESDYENIIEASNKAFNEWRMVPAPFIKGFIRSFNNIFILTFIT